MVFKFLLAASYAYLALVSFNVNAAPFVNILSDGNESTIKQEDLGVATISTLLSNTFNPDGGPTSVTSVFNAEVVQILNGNITAVSGLNTTITTTTVPSGVIENLISIFNPVGNQTNITVNSDGSVLYEGGNIYDSLFAGESYFINFDYVVTDTIDTVTSSFSLEIQGLGSPIATVPVPAAAWLFGSGLIWLVGMSRRKKS